MAKAKSKKKADIESELEKHVDLIGDKKVKEYILNKKNEKKVKEMGKAYMGKNVDMLEEEEEEEKMEIVQKVKAKKTKTIKKK